MEKKNVPIRVPVDLHLAASRQMLSESGEINFQRFVIQALETFVSGGSAASAAASLADSVGSKKEQAMVDQFLHFVRSAPKADVHMVLSLMARFTQSVKEDIDSSSEKKVNRR